MKQRVLETRQCENPACRKEIYPANGCVKFPKGRGRFCSRSCTSIVVNATRIGEHSLARHQAEREHIVSEVEFLIGTDCVVSLAQRLGYTKVESLSRRLLKLGREDLANRVDRDYRRYLQTDEKEDWT